jgi:hypothetical protein
MKYTIKTTLLTLSYCLYITATFLVVFVSALNFNKCFIYLLYEVTMLKNSIEIYISSNTNKVKNLRSTHPPAA